MASIHKAKKDSISSLPKKKRGRPRKNEQPKQAITCLIQKKNRSKDDHPDNHNEENSEHDSEKKNQSHEEEDEIILHIPFNLNDLKCFDKIGSSKKENTSTPEVVNTNIFTIADLSDNSYSDEYSDYNANEELVKKLKEKDETIRKLEESLKECKQIINDSIMPGINEKKVTKMDINLIHIDDGDQMLIETTNIACWWCTEQFKGIPCFLPEKYEDKKYHVYGCFCSYNCVAAYNMDIDDYKVWDRLSLIKKLYKDIFGNDKELAIAPPRQALIKFGGTLTIEDFRKNSLKNEKEYRYIIPPMVSIVPFIEETYKNTGKWDNIRSANPEENLILKRNAPLPNSKNTLFQTMGIVIK